MSASAPVSKAKAETLTRPLDAVDEEKKFEAPHQTFQQYQYPDRVKAYYNQIVAATVEYRKQILDANFASLNDVTAAKVQGNAYMMLCGDAMDNGRHVKVKFMAEPLAFATTVCEIQKRQEEQPKGSLVPLMIPLEYVAMYMKKKRSEVIADFKKFSVKNAPRVITLPFVRADPKKSRDNISVPNNLGSGMWPDDQVEKLWDKRTQSLHPEQLLQAWIKKVNTDTWPSPMTLPRGLVREDKESFVHVNAFIKFMVWSRDAQWLDSVNILFRANAEVTHELVKHVSMAKLDADVQAAADAPISSSYEVVEEFESAGDGVLEEGEMI